MNGPLSLSFRSTENRFYFSRTGSIQYKKCGEVFIFNAHCHNVFQIFGTPSLEDILRDLQHKTQPIDVTLGSGTWMSISGKVRHTSCSRHP